MNKMIAMISEGGNVELVDETMTKIAGTSLMTPAEASFLARSLLSCAALLAFDKSAKVGMLCADFDFPILKWVIRTRTETHAPIITFSVPPEIDLTFQMSPQLEKELGAALVAHAEGDEPPELSDTIQ